MTPLFLTLLLLTALTKSYQACLTPNQQPGKCVLINHCPHLFSTILKNHTSEFAQDHVKQSYCGFEAMIFPKVCCPLDALNLYSQAGAISHNLHATKCGLHEPDGRSDPWLALLEYKKPDGERVFLCGGVLITKRYVLTTAHCLKGPSIPEGVKLLNVHLTDSVTNIHSSLVVPVDGSTVHESYNPNDPNQTNDIALVRLKNKIAYKEGSVRPICIPTNDKKSFLGKTLQVTGWEKLNDTLKKRDSVATVWNNSECDLAYNTTSVSLRDSQMCVGGKKLQFKDLYRFDLGGVLMHVGQDMSYTAVGLLSIKPECCDKENNPKVYTRIDNYIGWIVDNLKP